jgi:hypothetical protein
LFPEFRAQLDPGRESVAELSALDPRNGFATQGFTQARRTLGFRPCLLGVVVGGKLEVGCLGFLKSGRMNCSLEVTSLPELSGHGEIFWKGLLQTARGWRVSRLEVGTFGSPAAAIPPLPRETRRRRRWEYVLRLEADLWEKLNENHRRSVRRARKLRMEMRRGEDEQACRAHADLILSSMERRKRRGENVPLETDVHMHRALLVSGVGHLFQGAAEGKVLSSVLVVKAQRGAYFQSSGNCPEGMAIGASHFLVHEVSRRLQEEGIEIFNLGGVEDPGSGLALFKSRFGAEVVELETAEFYLGSVIRKKLSTAIAMLWPRMRAGSWTVRWFSRRRPRRLPLPSSPEDSRSRS